MKASLKLCLRTDKETKKGTSPIFLRCSIKGERKYYNTGINVNSIQWDGKNEKIIELSAQNKKAVKTDLAQSGLLDRMKVNLSNKELNSIKGLAMNIEFEFSINDVAFSSKMLIDKLKQKRHPITKAENTNGSIASWIDFYAMDCTKQREGTIKCYIGLANHLRDFESSINSKVTFQNLDFAMLEKFRDFLNEEKKQTNNTMIKQVATLKTLLRRAEFRYDIEVNSDYKNFDNFKRQDASFEVIVLTKEEFERVRQIDLSHDSRLDRQRDIFVFSASTGLRYSDLKDLKRVHIKDDAIHKVCFKTKQPLFIPLTNISRSILKKYENDKGILPIISNDKCRKYVKEIAKLCGIDDEIEKVRFYGKREVQLVKPKYEFIGIHTARKTFVTLSLVEIPQQTVMAMTGHKSDRSFKRYVDVAKKQMVEAMSNAGVFN